MKTRLFTIFSLAILALQANAETQLRIHGSSTVHTALIAPNEAKIKEAGFELITVPNGSGNGVSDLLNAKTDIAMISSELDDVLEGLYKGNPPEKAKDLVVSTLQKIEASVIVHPSNSISELSNEKAAFLLSGKIDNWKEVNGRDIKPLVVTVIPGDGVRSTIEGKLLKKFGLTFSEEARVLPSANQPVSLVSKIPHSIGITSKNRLTPAVKAIKLDKAILQHLQIITIGEPSKELKEFIQLLQNF